MLVSGKFANPRTEMSRISGCNFIKHRIAHGSTLLMKGNHVLAVCSDMLSNIKQNSVSDRRGQSQELGQVG